MKYKVALQLWCWLSLNQFQWFVNSSDKASFEDLINGISAPEEDGTVEIDKDHLQKNPECGYLPEKPENLRASSRISNAEESDRHYPWVISVTRLNPFLPVLPGATTRCAGAIITQTTALTAAHCICGIPQKYQDTLHT